MTHGSNESGRKAARLRRSFATFLTVQAVVLLAGAEWALRSIGHRPWQPVSPRVRIEPGGKVTQPHPNLGYSAIPGSYVETSEAGAVTQFIHLPNTLRITRPISRYTRDLAKPQVWIFGCSFTHGSGLNDDETYPWQLQRRLPDHEVVNFGMGGYGTIHSLLQFREALKQTSPKVAVLAYAGFHDIRNTFLRTRRKEVVPYSKLGPFTQPYARLDASGDLEFHFAATEYRELPFMRHSALVHVIEMAYNGLEQRMHDSHAVSRALVLEMHRLAEQHGTVLVVADIWDGAAMLRFAERSGIANVDISLPRTPRFTLAPSDGHPNAQAARVYAERLKRFLRPRL